MDSAVEVSRLGFEYECRKVCGFVLVFWGLGFR